MAAGAYKGLTIRIGADTTRLSTALRGANSAIYKTQGELRKLNQAAKLDPGNTDVIKAQIGAIAGQAVAAAAKIDTLNRSIEEMSSVKANKGGSTIGELAESTDDAALAAENALARYNRLSDELGSIYNKIENVTKLDLGDATRQSSATFEKRVKELENWASAEGRTEEDLAAFAKKVGMSVDEAIAHVRHLKEAWNDANASYEDATLVNSLQHAKAELAATKASTESLARSMAEVNKASTLSANFKGIDTQMTMLNAAAETAADRFKRLDEAAKVNPLNINLAAERARALADATEVAREKASALKEKIDGYKAAGIDAVAKSVGNVSLNMEKTKQAYIDASKAVSELEGKLRNAEVAKQRLKDEGDIDSDEFRRLSEEVYRYRQELAKAKEAQDSALNDFDTAKQCSELRELQTEYRATVAEAKELGKVSWSDVGTAAVQAAQQIGALMERAGRKIVESSNEIDSSYRDLRKTLNASEEEYEHLYDAAMKYSQTHITSADTMLEMESLAAQVGVTKDAIQSFAETAANLDVATDIDASDIALKMGQIVNVMGDLDEGSVNRFADSLVRLGNNMPAQESAIMNIAQRMSSVANITSMSTPDLLAWSAAIASTGAKSEAAATAIANTMTGIESAVAGGGDELQAFADIANMSAEEFADAWNNDPTVALKGFIEGLKELEDSDESAISALEKMGIKGVRQKSNLLALTSTIDNLNDALTMSNDAFNGVDDKWGAAGDAAREAERKSEGFSGALAKMKNNAQVLAAEFGESMVPWMETASDIMQKLISFVDKMSDKSKGMAVIVGGAFAAIATIEPVVEAAYKNIAKVIGGIAQKIGGAFGAVKALGITSFDDAVAAVGLGLEEVGTKIEPIATALGELATTGKLVTGAFGAIAVAVGVEYAKYIGESMIETSKFNSVLEGLEKTTEGLHGALWNGKEDIDVYGQSWEDLRVDMGDFFSEMEKHNKTNAETRDEATASIGQLERWRQVIDEAAGKGNDFAGSELELKTAIEGVNEVLGTNYEVADVLAGVYVDQTGAVKELRTEIDRLIETKKREIRLSALEDIYKEDVKAQAEAQNAYDKAIAAKQKFLEEWKAENLGTVWKDENQGREIVIDESNWESYARATTEYKLLDQAAEETNAVLKETGEQLDITEKQWEGYADELAFLSSNNFGIREGIMLTNQAIAESIMENTDWGKSLEEIQPSVKTLAQGLETAKVGVTEFNDLAKNHPDLFGQMLVEADGDMDKLIDLISEWNMAQLEEKYGKFDYDEQAFIDAEGNRTEWNEDEWVPVDLRVNDYVSDVLDKVGYNLGEMTNEAGINLGELVLGLEKAGVSAEQFAGISQEQFAAIADAANGDVNAIIAVIAQLNGTPIDDKTAEFHFDEENNLVDAENKQVEWNEETKRWEPVEITAESNVEETVDEAVEYAESEEATMSIDGDASGVEEEAEEAKSKIESEPIQQQVVTNRVDDGATATENVDTSQTVNVSVQTDVTKLDELQQKLNELKEPVTTTVTVVADESAAGNIVESLAALTEPITATVSVTEDGVAKASKHVKDLAEAAAKMSSVTAKYTAEGNAATSKDPATNVRSLNAAAANMSAVKASYTASGNAATSDAPANRIWNLVNAVNSLPTRKDVTVNYSLNTKGSAPAGAGSSASGAYVPYDKIPRHAAGIFTRPTLTNIGWVGEDGAELYSGNSLIPLTNRKYSMPYINDISDAVARKLGPVESGPTINITITGVSGPDETADAIERKLRLLGF